MNRDAIATVRTSNSLPRSPASFADAAPQTLITYGSCSRAPWGVGSATSSWFRSVEHIIEPSIGEATRLRGGSHQICTRLISLNEIGFVLLAVDF